ncbi:MAG: Vacuolar protein sorting-associated protein 53 [Bathelium mastoideum]|nr:MAG: Vacuolar protein sorting-associated protein 53 [Bathelium mastoideum]
MPQLNGFSEPLNSLDSVDYNPLDHLNAIFSHPSTLSSISQTSNALQSYQNDLDDEIADQLELQAASDVESVRRIQVAKAELADLFKRVESVRERALQTEQAITEMTAEIKRLDGTKRNLTWSMTALKRLQMLTTAYEQLRGLIKTRQYEECAQMVQAVIQLMAHFKSYRSIDQIATLSRNVAELQRELLEQVCEDFEITFAKGEVAQKRVMLLQACHVMDALGDEARHRLVNWYCNTQLREYRQIFRGNEEAGSLDNISRRYSWFNRMLRTYDMEHANIFPPHWRVNERLANTFCEGTREDYKGILQRSMRRNDGQPPDVNLLLSCLQETLDFEHSLEKRFATDSRSSVDTMSSGRDEKTHAFGQAISEAFEPYLSVWVESQDRHLSTLIPKYRLQPLRNPDEEFSSQLVIPSSTELFHSYRITFAQCAKLSTGDRLLELTKTFAKYLDQYGQQVLFYFLSEKSGPQGPSIEDTILIMNTADYCYTTVNQLEERIKARIDTEYRDSVDLQSQADAFMGIAGAAVRCLVRKVELDTEQCWREMRQIGWSKLDSVGDSSSYVADLLTRLRSCVGDILTRLPNTKPQYARAFCDNLVDAVATSFLNTLVASRPISEVGAEQLLLDAYTLKKGLSDLGALPTNTTTSTTKDSSATSPTTTTTPSTPSPAFVKRVATTMAKLDPLLKTLQVRAAPPEGLVQAYLIHLRDASEPNFRKLLDLKGVHRRADQTHLAELFNAHKASPAHAGLAPSNPLLASLSLGGAGAGGGGNSSSGGAGGPGAAGGNSSSGSGGSVGLGLLTAPQSLSMHPLGSGSTPILGAGAPKFDAATLGSALLSAARDGVDRLGSPALGGSSEASRTASPPQGAGVDGGAGGGQGTSTPANLNENLKSIGKFFRRDVGAFGRFGGGKSGD